MQLNIQMLSSALKSVKPYTDNQYFQILGAEEGYVQDFTWLVLEYEKGWGYTYFLRKRNDSTKYYPPKRGYTDKRQWYKSLATLRTSIKKWLGEVPVCKASLVEYQKVK